MQEPMTKQEDRLIEVDVSQLQKAMQAEGAPWTPGTIPQWPQQ
jgi:hypothetical protein